MFHENHAGKANIDVEAEPTEAIGRSASRAPTSTPSGGRGSNGGRREMSQ